MEVPVDTELRNPVAWDPKMYPHEMWAILDLDQEGWKDYSKFTLRLSWAASASPLFSVLKSLHIDCLI